MLGLVMREGATLIAAGTIIGLAVAWAGLRALAGIFFSVASVQSSEPVLLVPLGRGVRPLSPVIYVEI